MHYVDIEAADDYDSFVVHHSNNNNNEVPKRLKGTVTKTLLPMKQASIVFPTDSFPHDHKKNNNNPSVKKTGGNASKTGSPQRPLSASALRKDSMKKPSEPAAFVVSGTSYSPHEEQLPRPLSSRRFVPEPDPDSSSATTTIVKLKRSQLKERTQADLPRSDSPPLPSPAPSSTPAYRRHDQIQQEHEYTSDRSFNSSSMRDSRVHLYDDFETTRKSLSSSSSSEPRSGQQQQNDPSKRPPSPQHELTKLSSSSSSLDLAMSPNARRQSQVAQLISRFRNAQPRSRDERAKSPNKFWWQQQQPSPKSSDNASTKDDTKLAPTHEETKSTVVFVPQSQPRRETAPSSNTSRDRSHLSKDEEDHPQRTSTPSPRSNKELVDGDEVVMDVESLDVLADQTLRKTERTLKANVAHPYEPKGNGLLDNLRDSDDDEGDSTYNAFNRIQDRMKRPPSIDLSGIEIDEDSVREKVRRMLRERGLSDSLAAEPNEATTSKTDTSSDVKQQDEKVIELEDLEETVNRVKRRLGMLDEPKLTAEPDHEGISTTPTKPQLNNDVHLALEASLAQSMTPQQQSSSPKHEGDLNDEGEAHHDSIDHMHSERDVAESPFNRTSAKEYDKLDNTDDDSYHSDSDISLSDEDHDVPNSQQQPLQQLESSTVSVDNTPNQDHAGDELTGFNKRDDTFRSSMFTISPLSSVSSLASIGLETSLAIREEVHEEVYEQEDDVNDTSLPQIPSAASSASLSSLSVQHSTDSTDTPQQQQQQQQHDEEHQSLQQPVTDEAMESCDNNGHHDPAQQQYPPTVTAPVIPETIQQEQSRHFEEEDEEEDEFERLYDYAEEDDDEDGDTDEEWKDDPILQMLKAKVKACKMELRKLRLASTPRANQNTSGCAAGGGPCST